MLIDREELLKQMDAEIAYARTVGMPVFVMGLQQARKLIEEYEEGVPFRDGSTETH